MRFALVAVSVKINIRGVLMEYLYSVWDKVAHDSCPPFVTKNDAVAARKFRELLAKTVTPDDYELWRIAQFSSCDMTLEPMKQIKITMEGIEDGE